MILVIRNVFMTKHHIYSDPRKKLEIYEMWCLLSVLYLEVQVIWLYYFLLKLKSYDATFNLLLSRYSWTP